MIFVFHIYLYIIYIYTLFGQYTNYNIHPDKYTLSIDLRCTNWSAATMMILHEKPSQRRTFVKCNLYTCTRIYNFLESLVMEEIHPQKKVT